MYRNVLTHFIQITFFHVKYDFVITDNRTPSRFRSQQHVTVWCLIGVIIVQCFRWTNVCRTTVSSSIVTACTNVAIYFKFRRRHNDLPHNLRRLLENKLQHFHFEDDLRKDPVFGPNCDACHTDFPRLKEGKVGAVFWVAYVDCESKKENPVIATLQQIDVIKRLVNKYPDNLKFVTTADGILEAFSEGKIACLIGVEGGHSIVNKFSILRTYYDLGVRYLTLTHVCNLDWADSATSDAHETPINNLTEHGKEIVREMNRLGMMVDLAHVSRNVMIDALHVSRAPVIFSHSSSKKVYSHVRNVDDDVLQLLKENRGVIMVNFFSRFIAEGNATIQSLIEHINHIVDVTGVDFVGLGSDFDGVNQTPEGLEDVSKYPRLFDLLREGNQNRWTIENLEKLAGKNLVRVFKEVEKVKRKLVNETPREEDL